MRRVVFMGTPEFALPVLRALLATQEVVGVVTQPDRPAGRGQALRPSPVKVVAQEAGLPLYQPASLRKAESAEPIAAWQPDAIVVAAYGQILRPRLLQLPPFGCINVHASLLPRWRGASPIQHAILAGDVQSGISLMQMDEGLDTGPIYVREAIDLDERETTQSLHDRLAELGGEVVRRSLTDIFDSRLAAAPQEEVLATYAPLIKKEDGRLDWRQSAAQLDRRIRAMSPWPGAFSRWQGRQLKILAARPWPDAPPPAAEPGAILWRQGALLAAAGGGALELLEVQLAGKRTMSATDFVNGHPDFVGSRLDRGQEGD